MGKVFNPDALQKVFVEKGYTLDEWLDSLRTSVSECRTAIIELIDDHATTKTAVDGQKTAIDELVDDHATFKSAVDSLKTAVDELIADHATFKTVVDELTAWAEALATKLNLDGGVTDVDYDAVITADAPATLSASSPSAGPATLTASKPSAGPATLTAGDPTAVPFAFGA